MARTRNLPSLAPSQRCSEELELGTGSTSCPWWNHGKFTRLRTHPSTAQSKRSVSHTRDSLWSCCFGSAPRFSRRTCPPCFRSTHRTWIDRAIRGGWPLPVLWRASQNLSRMTAMRSLSRAWKRRPMKFGLGFLRRSLAAPPGWEWTHKYEARCWPCWSWCRLSHLIRVHLHPSSTAELSLQTIRRRTKIKLRRAFAMILIVLW